MNKRTLSLILALLMLVSMLFTSCDALFGNGEETDPSGEIVEEASNSAMTLSMYVVSKEPVSPETADLVEEAFNRITKVNFKTQVKLHYATYEEYYDKISEVMESNRKNVELEKEAKSALKAAKKIAKAEGVVTDEAWFDKFYEDHPEYAPFRETEELTGEDTTAEETELVTIQGIDNSYTLSQVKYPEEKDAQIDILWIDSYDRYKEFVDAELLSRLDEELSGSSKKLNEYINNTLLEWAKWSTNGTFGIPNNVIIGEYTYLLVNKELAQKYSYDPSKLTSLSACSDFLADIKTYEPDAIPVLGDIYPTNILYWNVNPENGKLDSSDFSILGAAVGNRVLDPSVETNNPITFSNLFANASYIEQISCIQKYKDAGYVVSDTNTDKQYGVRLVKGGAELEKIYGEEYQMNIVEYPVIGYEEVFSNMFAVSAYTRNVRRSMQIITYLNTNSDLRNILQYGIEGTHYELDDVTGKVVRLNRDYIMDIETTGNVFMAYPEEDMDLDIWEWGKKQNRDARVYLLMCFDVSNRLELPDGEDPETYKLVDTEQLKLMRDKSADVLSRVEKCKDYAELELLIAEFSKLHSTEKFIKDQIDIKNENGTINIYRTWMQDTGLYVPSEE